MQVADAYQELVDELENLRNAYKQVDREDLVEDARKKIKFLVQERKRIEKDIINLPQYWLWTHKRWKHKKEK